MIGTGTLFWLWSAWWVVATAAIAAWWYESRVIPAFRRRQAKLAADLETARAALAARTVAR